MPPLFSTITLITEIGVTLAILTVFYKSTKTGVFPKKLAFLTLAYEIIFNISYMTYSSIAREAHEKSVFTWKTGLAIFHGTLSLVMFVSLIVFFIVAYKAYKKGENYFQVHKLLTRFFLFFWFTSIISGTVLYFAEYFL
jgi:hypothetical protein